MKQKTCKVCKKKYPPHTFNPMIPVCSPDCAIAYTRQQKAKKVAEKAKQERRDLRQRKEALKSKHELTKEAQYEFNRFIRFRDYLQPCRSCGRTEDQIEWTIRGKWDCGHYRSVGAQPALRFEERNAYKQCKSCNGGSGNYARKNYTVAKEYEERLRAYIGDELVDWLNKDHPEKNYTHDEIRAIKVKYRKMANEIKRNLECES